MTHALLKDRLDDFWVHHLALVHFAHFGCNDILCETPNYLRKYDLLDSR